MAGAPRRRQLRDHIIELHHRLPGNNVTLAKLARWHTEEHNRIRTAHTHEDADLAVGAAPQL